MRSLLKKKAEAAASQVPAWHPNFRNYQRLPDIKVVRTAFFINGFAALFAIALIVWTGLREFDIYKTNEQIAATQALIDKNQPESNRAVTLYKKFQDEEKRANEVDAFVKSKPLVSAILQHFAETRPRNIALDRIDIRDTGIVLIVSVRGDTVSAYSDNVNYVELLKKDAFFNSLYEPAEIKAANPDPATGFLKSEIIMPIKKAPAPAAKK
jgi:hypothetical protein